MTKDNIELPANVVVEADFMADLWTKEFIKEDQNHIRASLASLDLRIHKNAVQCMMHAEKHGDTSLFRRLLIDIVDAKSGYRRRGLIAWMAHFSPMRLTKDNINLSGLTGDIRQAFRVKEAYEIPFWTLEESKEMVPYRPIFKDNLTSKIERAIKEYRAAIDNTLIVPGQPPQPKVAGKPFYNGIHLDKMELGFDAIEKTVTEILAFADQTKDVYTAREAMKKAELEVAAAAGDKQ